MPGRIIPPQDEVPPYLIIAAAVATRGFAAVEHCLPGAGALLLWRGRKGEASCWRMAGYDAPPGGVTDSTTYPKSFLLHSPIHFMLVWRSLSCVQPVLLFSTLFPRVDCEQMLGI